MRHLLHSRTEKLDSWNMIGISGDENRSVVVVVDTESDQVGDDGRVDTPFNGSANVLSAMRTTC